MENESKLEAGVPNSKLKVPPNSCIPRSAKMRINKNSRRRRDTMDFSEAKRETTRFLSEDQYLIKPNKSVVHKSFRFTIVWGKSFNLSTDEFLIAAAIRQSNE